MKFLKKKFLRPYERMELRFSGQFQKDIAHRNKKISEIIKKAILDVWKALSPQQIPNMKKLRDYDTHYRISLGDYRIGIIIRKNTVWFTRFGQRNLFYKKLFP